MVKLTFFEEGTSSTNPGGGLDDTFVVDVMHFPFRACKSSCSFSMTSKKVSKTGISYDSQMFSS